MPTLCINSKNNKFSIPDEQTRLQGGVQMRSKRTLVFRGIYSPADNRRMESAEQQNMRRWQHGVSFSRNSKVRWEKRLRQLAQMRSAKERKRLARLADGWTPEPKMKRYYPFEFGVRVKATGESHFTDLRSSRHAAKALCLILKYFQP